MRKKKNFKMILTINGRVSSAIQNRKSFASHARERVRVIGELPVELPFWAG